MWWQTVLEKWPAELRDMRSACKAWLADRKQVRTLVGEIMTLQMLLTAFVGAIAIAGLFWTSQDLVRGNVDRWAIQWADELQELGAPLYLEDDVAAVLNVERYVSRYPEVVSVSYFDAAGNPRHTILGSAESKSDEQLDAAVVSALAARAGAGQSHLMEGLGEQGRFVIRRPVWTESIVGDGLFSLDSGGKIESEIQVLGFVALELNFAPYFGQIGQNVRLASLVLLALLLSTALISRFLLQRSLRGLSSLQAPIEKLAQGDLDVQFPTPAHSEIASIVDTLKNTLASLRQRDSKLIRLANHDALTGLYNRHRFVDELNNDIVRVARDAKQSALLFIDLDQFKYVNDTCGHPAGDKLLICAARQLRRSVRKYDTISRFGGDEFAILVRNVTRREAKAIAIVILEQMRDFAHVENDHVFQLQCSIGITMISSSQWSADEIVAQADLACHEAKRRGRNRMEFYRVSAKETEQMKEDVGWTQRIKQALADDGFELRFQPIVNIATGRTVHHEVLLRMRLPDGRIVAPNVFLPAAERFGLMLDIDRWVLGKAIAELARMRLRNADLSFTINLSAHAFEAKDLQSRIKELLELHRVPAERVVFEITEQVAIRNIVEVERQMLSLKSLGCRIAIDDFGTGYSSFAHLKRFKFDFLKIDGSFVEELARDPVDQTMVRLFADIGKSLGVPTIAEFVTNATSYALLAKFGIDYAQGYHIGRPTEEPELPQLAIPIESRRRQGGKSARAPHVEIEDDDEAVC
jgi:diguanylate cyclase (GGDEF)-like protein